MFKILLPLMFTTFLLLPNFILAEDNASSEPIQVEAAEEKEVPKEEISEAQKEADAAEAAELREAAAEEALTQ